MKENNSRDSLMKTDFCGRPVAYGSLIYDLSSPNTLWAYQQAGLDWLWLDTEHTPNDDHTISVMAEMDAKMNLPLLVRARDVTCAPLSKSLDLGARGIIVPRVENAEQAALAVSQCFFPPMGRRGFGMTPRLLPDRKKSLKKQLSILNEKATLLVQIETVEGLKNVEEIVGVKGLSGVLFGPGDLSVGLGVPGHYFHPKMIVAMEKVVAACRNASIDVGYHSGNPLDVKQAQSMGFNLLSLGYDTDHLRRGVEAALSQMR